MASDCIRTGQLAAVGYIETQALQEVVAAAVGLQPQDWHCRAQRMVSAAEVEVGSFLETVAWPCPPSVFQALEAVEVLAEGWRSFA